MIAFTDVSEFLTYGGIPAIFAENSAGQWSAVTNRLVFSWNITVQSNS